MPKGLWRIGVTPSNAGSVIVLQDDGTKETISAALYAVSNIPPPIQELSVLDGPDI